MRTALRVGAIVLGILAVAAGVALITHRDELLARLTTSVTRTLSDRIGGRIDIGRVRLDLVPLTLVVEQVTVHSSSPEVPAAPFWVERIVVRPSLISLLTETPVIRWLRLEHPRIDLVAGPGGATNAPRLVDSTGRRPSAAPVVLIKRIEIRDAEVAIQTPTRAVSFKGVSATVLPDFVTVHIGIEMAAEEGTVAIGPHTLPLNAVRARVVVDRRHVTVAAVSVEGPGLSAKGQGTIALDQAQAVDLTANASIDLSPLVAALAPESPLAGRVSTTFRIKGPLPEPTVEGEIDAHGLGYADVSLGDVSAAIEHRNGRLTLTNVNGRLLGGTAHGHGTIDLAVVPPVWTIAAELSHVRPIAVLQRAAPWSAMFSRFDASGPLELTGRGFAAHALEGRGRLAVAVRENDQGRHPAEPKAPGSRLAALVALMASADIPWTLRQEHLELTGAAINTATGSLTVRGTIALSGDADLSLEMADQDVAAVTEALAFRFAAGGTGAFRGRLNGRLSSPVVEGRASVRNLLVRGQPAGDLDTTVRYADRVLSFRDTTWGKGEARYDTVGALDWRGESVPAFDLTATLHRARVEDVLPIAFHSLPIRASADGTFIFRGSPEDFLIAADLTLADGSLWGQSFDHGSVSMTFDRQRVSFSRAVLRRGDSEVRGRGSIAYRGEYDAQFEAPNVHLQTLDLFGLNTLPIAGTVSSTLSMKGTFAQPEMHGAATILYLEGAGQSLGSGRVTLDVVDRRLALVATLDDQHARLSGTLRWEPGFPMSAVFTLDDSSLVPLLRPWLPAIFADLNAAVSGRGSVEGPLLDPLGWRGEAHLGRLVADVGEYVVENQGDLVFLLERGRLTADAFRLRGTDTTLSVSGSVDLFEEYRLLIVGEADLRLTRLFVPTVTSGRGKTYLVLKISDRWDSPKIQGGVTIQNARIKTRALPQPITVTTVGLFFNERQIVLESLEGSLGNGRVSANGQIQLKGFRADRFGILLDLAGVQYPLTERLTPTFSGQLVFSGTPAAQTLRGELTVDRALYEARIDVQDWLLDLRKRTEAQTAAAEAPAFTRRLALNVHFTGRDQVAIKNNLADLPLEVDVFLKGTVDRPYLIGRIEAHEGRITFRGNVFTVQSATVDFIDPTKFRPVVDLRATTKVQEYAITLALSGTIERFDLDLSSDPSLSETDILALLTVGRTTEQVARSQTNVGREEAVSLAMQQLLEEGVQRLPGVDRLVDSFQIDPHYDPTLNTSAPELSVGKQLFDERLVLRYSTTLDATGRQGVRVEYQIARNLFLIGEQDSIRGFGGDVRFRFEFR